MAVTVVGAIIIGAVVSAVISGAVGLITNKINTEQREEELADQAEVEIAALERQRAVAEAELPGIQGEGAEKMSEVGRAGVEAQSKQLAGYAFGGAAVAEGTPLSVLTTTAAQAQSDVSFTSDYYAALLAAKQSEISGYTAEIGQLQDIVTENRGFDLFGWNFGQKKKQKDLMAPNPSRGFGSTKPRLTVLG